MMKAEAPATRVVGIDVARGALMAWIVIVIHGMFWLRLVPQPIASLALFEMPLIFMIAGAAHFYSERAPAKRDARRGSYLDYLARRGVRILVPYFAYALTCAVIVLAVRPGAVSAAETATTIADWLNPVTAGSTHTLLMLNWHLWFVPAFLAVIAIMPLLARAGAAARAPPWALTAGGLILVFLADALDSTPLGVFQMIVFYALWAAFGFTLAAAPDRFRTRGHALVLVLALAALAVAALALPGRVVLDMQANKFPPNAVFFLFSCAWVSLFLMAAPRIDARLVAAAARSPMLRPFMRAGYSIYLWQGLGYSAAIVVGRHFDWPALGVWPLAIALSVALGSLAAPLERVRFARR